MESLLVGEVLGGSGDGDVDPQCPDFGVEVVDLGSVAGPAVASSKTDCQRDKRDAEFGGCEPPDPGDDRASRDQLEKRLHAVRPVWWSSMRAFSIAFDIRKTTPARAATMMIGLAVTNSPTPLNGARTVLIR